MRYIGGKFRISKDIVPIILKDREPGQWYVEPFCGGCNVIDKVPGDKRIASDKNRYLIAMFKAFQEGWIPPRYTHREEYEKVREAYKKGTGEYPDYYLGYIGLSCGYGGIFFGAYAGTVKTKEGRFVMYPREVYNGVMRQIPFLKGIKFECSDYFRLHIPDNSIIYCDPPYEGTRNEYIGSFDNNAFWKWARNMRSKGHTVFISEYNAPDYFICIWSKKLKNTLKAGADHGGYSESIEKLFTLA